MLSNVFSRTLILLSIVCGLEFALIFIVGNATAFRIFGMRAGIIFFITLGISLHINAVRYVGSAILSLFAGYTLIRAFLDPHIEEVLIASLVLSGAVISVASVYYLIFSRTFSANFNSRKEEESKIFRWARMSYGILCGLVIYYFIVREYMHVMGSSNP